MGWSTLLKTTGKYVLKGGRATVESAGSAVIHPQRTIKGLGTTAKTAAIAAVWPMSVGKSSPQTKA